MNLETVELQGSTLRLDDSVYLVDDVRQRVGEAARVCPLVPKASTPVTPPLALKTWHEPPPPVAWLAQCADGLKRLAHIPGLLVADRRVVTLRITNPSPAVSTRSGETPGVLMPWIDGPTFAELMEAGIPLQPSEALAAALSLAESLEALETLASWHGSVRESHIVLSLVGPPREEGRGRSPAPVELVGLEALHALGWPDRPPADVPLALRPPLHVPAGHARRDRFHGGLQIALLLGWCDDVVRALAHGDTFFAEEEIQRDCPRFHELVRSLKRRWGDKAATYLEAAWASLSPETCPPFDAWAALVRTLSDEHGGPPPGGAAPVADSPLDATPAVLDMPTQWGGPEAIEDPLANPAPPADPAPKEAEGPPFSWGRPERRHPEDRYGAGPETLILQHSTRARAAARASGGSSALPRGGPGHRERLTLLASLVVLLVVVAGLVARLLWMPPREGPASGSSPGSPSPSVGVATSVAPAGSTGPAPSVAPAGSTGPAPSVAPAGSTGPAPSVAPAGSTGPAPEPSASPEPSAAPGGAPSPIHTGTLLPPSAPPPAKPRPRPSPTRTPPPAGLSRPARPLRSDPPAYYRPPRPRPATRPAVPIPRQY